MTKEEVTKVVDQIRADGYTGPIRKTEVAGETYVIRAIRRNEMLAIEEKMPYGATVGDTEKAMAEVAVYPIKDWDELGCAVLPTLMEKVRILSGAPAQNSTVAYFQDEIVEVGEGWDRPTAEELDELRELNRPLRLTSFMEKWFFVYGQVTGAEYKSCLVQAGDDEELLKALVRNSVVVWPKEIDWDNLAVGISEMIDQKILLFSGYDMNVSIEDDEEL